MHTPTSDTPISNLHTPLADTAPSAPATTTGPAAAGAEREAGRRPDAAARAEREAGRRPDAAAEAVRSPARSVGFTLSSLGYAVARRFKTTLAPLGLEPREFALLRTLAPREGASQQAISERMQIPASRMVAFVDGLERRGLLERRPHPRDRRARALHLTDDGRKLLARALKLAGGLERELCAQLSDAERERLLDALQRVGAQLSVAPGTHSAHHDG